MSPYSYHHFKPLPKSKQPFYATSEHWKDIKPIPLIEHGPPDQNPALGGTDPGPALATIAYSQRYLEAMSYLRAVLADNEYSERCLALTEDIIGMNPAHYTVWLYRMACLKHLWGINQSTNQSKVVEDESLEETRTDEPIKSGIDKELSWLEVISERNLKNYQIWHHRQSLLTLLPTQHATSTFLTTSEIPFLTHMLSFDAKNYHVWTYRQWLCRRFKHHLLPSSPSNNPGSESELLAIDTLLATDVRNNSAWSHRYFVVFGAQELDFLEGDGDGVGRGMTRKELFDDIKLTGGKGVLVVDEGVVKREVGYAKEKIGLAPQNPSPWNYLRGVLKRAGWGLVVERGFCEGFVRGEGGDGEGVGGGKRELDFMGESVRSSHAIDWLAEIYSELGGEEDRERAKRCLKALGEKWDPIRKNYWDYRVMMMERGEYAGT